jgi:hypothetical protein
MITGSLSFTFPGAAGSNFLGKIVERFRFIFSFLHRKNNSYFSLKTASLFTLLPDTVKFFFALPFDV